MNTIIQIGTKTWKHWKAISFIFVVQLFAGLVGTITFYTELSNQLSGSMVLDHLANGFDRTVLMDVMNSSDDVLGPTVFVSAGMIILYLIVGAFLQAGWLVNIRKNTYSLSALLDHAKQYFFPFFGIGIISIFLVLLVGIGGGIGFSTIVGDPLVTFSSEKPFVLWIVFLAILFICWSILVWSWAIACRCHYISDASFLACLRAGLNSMKKYFGKFMAIGLLVFGIHVLFMFLYYWIMGDRGAPNWSIVIIGIFVQQIFNYLRIALRGFGYALIEDLV